MNSDKIITIRLKEETYEELIQIQKYIYEEEGIKIPLNKIIIYAMNKYYKKICKELK